MHGYLQVLQARGQVEWDNVLQQARAKVKPWTRWWGPLCLPSFQSCAERQAGAPVAFTILCSKQHQIRRHFLCCRL